MARVFKFKFCDRRGGYTHYWLGEHGGSVVERQTPEREVGVRNLPPSCCVLKQDTLLPESTGNTQEAVTPSGHDWKIVGWDFKPQHKQTNKQIITENFVI